MNKQQSIAGQLLEWFLVVVVGALLVGVILGASGCSHRLPNLRADEIHARTSILGVTATTDATGIKVTDATIRADDVSWGLAFPGFDHVTHTKGYQQKRDREAADAPAAPVKQ